MCVSKNLFLRDLVFEDYIKLFENYWSDKKSTKYLLFQALENFSEAKFKIEKMIASLEFSDEYLFCICKKDGEQIGVASLKKSGRDKIDDIVVGIGSKFFGHGYGKEVVEMLLSFSFLELNVKSVFSSCMENNISSIKLHKKTGFEFVGISENKTRKVDGLNFKLLKFRILKRTWLSKNKNSKKKGKIENKLKI